VIFSKALGVFFQATGQVNIHMIKWNQWASDRGQL